MKVQKISSARDDEGFGERRVKQLPRDLGEDEGKCCGGMGEWDYRGDSIIFQGKREQDKEFKRMAISAYKR